MRRKIKWIGLLLLPILLELLVFNYAFVSSRILDYQDCTEECTIDVTKSMKLLEDGGYRCENEERSYVEITDIDQKIFSVYLDVSFPVVYPSDKFVTVNVYGMDEGNSAYYLMGTHDIVHTSEESKWLFLHFYGDAKSIMLNFQVKSEQVIYIHEVQLNKMPPLFIHWERLLLMYLAGFLYYILRGKNKKLWDVDFESGYVKYRIATLGVALCLALGVLIVVKLDTPVNEIHQNLTKAFLSGHLYVDEEPPEYLLEMENPYDYYAREALRHKTKEQYLWDYAFYDGKYYVYFGVLPVLLLYLPVYVLTGVMLRTDLVMGIIALLLILACFYFVWTIFKRWFPSSPYLFYPVLSLTLFFGTGSMTLLRKPEVYEVCIGAALVCMLFGLAFWIRATEKEQLHKGRLFLGALFVASTAVCRPQFLIGMVFGVILFLPRFIENRRLQIIKYKKELLCLSIPFVVIAVCVMTYNYVRFQSVFEFGATYNLTTNAVEKRGWNIGRSIYGLYEYLLRPLKVIPRFPFLDFQEMDTSYLGLTIYERHIGGMLWYNPLLFLVAGKIFDKNDKKQQLFWKLSIGAWICTLIVVIANTNMGGIVERYQVDFLWMLYLIIIIGLLCKEQYIKEEVQRISLRNKIVAISFLTIFLNFLMLWTDDIYDMYINNLEIFTQLKYLFNL